MANETILNRGFIVCINNIMIGEILDDGVPIPDVISGVAKLRYNLSPDDLGQTEVEKSYYGKNNKIHKFDINIRD